jgi:hypothetical protein
MLGLLPTWTGQLLCVDVVFVSVDFDLLFLVGCEF